jgi:hypothetical protein
MRFVATSSLLFLHLLENAVLFFEALGEGVSILAQMR